MPYPVTACLFGVLSRNVMRYACGGTTGLERPEEPLISADDESADSVKIDRKETDGTWRTR